MYNIVIPTSKHVIICNTLKYIYYSIRILYQYHLYPYKLMYTLYTITYQV